MVDYSLRGVGANDNVLAQVDPTHQAVRFSLRPIDHVQPAGLIGGHYRFSAISGAVAGAVAANGQLFSLRWVDTSRIFKLLKVLASAKCEAFSSGIGVDLELIRATSYSASPTGGTTIIPATTAQMARTATMRSSAFASAGDVRVASTAALGAGTATLDTVGLGNGMIGATGAGAGGQVELFSAISEAHALDLTQNEGFVIRSTAGFAASNTWRFAFTIIGMEMAAY